MRRKDNSLPVCCPFHHRLSLLIIGGTSCGHTQTRGSLVIYILGSLLVSELGFDRKGPCLRLAPRNHPSAVSNQPAVNNYIEAELEAGHVVGPIAHNLTDCLHSSPIGLVPKSNQVGKWRMIVDLSFPRGHSINDRVSKNLSSITYAWVDDAVTRILQLGRGTQLAKFDLKNAYRNVPIHPHDQHLLAFCWTNETYVFACTLKGIRRDYSSPRRKARLPKTPNVLTRIFKIWS